MVPTIPTALNPNELSGQIFWGVFSGTWLLALAYYAIIKKNQPKAIKAVAVNESFNTVVSSTM
jgi:exosortase/archaeosortase